MRHRHSHGRRGWPTPLDPVQRVRMVRAVRAPLAALLTGLAWGKVRPPRRRPSVCPQGGCMAARWELPICLDVARAHVGWRH